MASQNQTTDSSLWLRLSRPVRHLPGDLAGIVLLVVVTNAFVFLPAVNETPLRVVVGLVFLLLVPGYVLTAMLFPGVPQSRSDDSGRYTGWMREEYGSPTLRSDGIDGVERVALSFGMSLAMLPLFALALTFIASISPVTILGSVSVFALAGAAYASVRRSRLPEDRRFTVQSWMQDVRRRVFSGSGVDLALNLVVIVAALLLATTAVYAVAAPNEGESFTTVSLVTEDANGDFVAGNHPDVLTQGESETMHLVVDNHEGEYVTYTVVVELQRVRSMSGSPTVMETEELARMEGEVAPSDRWQADHDIEPTMAGEDLRLTYMVYKGEPPANPTTEDAYRTVHIWIDVEPLSSN